MSTVDVAEALAKATGGEVRPASDDDAVAGVPASWVAAPGSTDEVGDVLRVAAEHDLAVVPRGGASKLDWGVAPERVDLILDTRRLDRVVEHAAGDLVAVVEAGVPLAALAERLADAGQRLALDETVSGETVGGAIATGASGPGRLLYGTVRDLVIGSTLVRADGMVAKSGGRVVKNVAGYDLSKLVCGSYGTLGVITRAAFRLHPLPAARAFVSAVTGDPAATHAAVQRALHGQAAPTAIELDRPPGEPATVTVLLEGTEAGIAARAAQVAELLGNGATVGAEPPPGWGRYPADRGDVLLKLTSALGALGRLLAALDRAAADAGLPVTLRGSAGAGVLYAGVPVGAPGRGGAVVGAGPGPAGSPGRGGAVVGVAPDQAGSPARGGAGAAPDQVRAPAAAAVPPGETPEPERDRGLAGAGQVDAAAVGELVDRLRREASGWAGTVVALDAPAAVRARLDMWGPVPGLPLMRRVKAEFDPGRRLSPGRFVGGI